MIQVKRYTTLPFCEREALKWLGVANGKADGETLALLREVALECERVLKPSVCYTRVPIVREGEILCFPTFQTQSKHLSTHLNGCNEAYVIAATVGVGIDRLLSRYASTNALRFAAVQAVGAAYIESLCDLLCEELKAECVPLKLTPRFSPGYGDFSLEAQRGIFQLLQPEKKIALTLNQSLLMSPSKSVTAVIGIGNAALEVQSGCKNCSQAECTFRR